MKITLLFYHLYLEKSSIIPPANISSVVSITTPSTKRTWEILFWPGSEMVEGRLPLLLSVCFFIGKNSYFLHLYYIHTFLFIANRQNVNIKQMPVYKPIDF